MVTFPSRSAAFIAPIECRAAARLPEGPEWIYELKLDGYRAAAVITAAAVTLFSRRGKSFNRQYPDLVEELAGLPNDTVVDGEVVALDEQGRPNFHLLQQFRSKASRIHYFIFDLLILEGRDLTIPARKTQGTSEVAPGFRSPRIRISEQFDTSAREILSAVTRAGLGRSRRQAQGPPLSEYQVHQNTNNVDALRHSLFPFLPAECLQVRELRPHKA